MAIPDLRYAYLPLSLLCAATVLFVAYKVARIVIKNRSVRARATLLLMYSCMIIDIVSCTAATCCILLKEDEGTLMSIASNVEVYTNTVVIFVFLGRLTKRLCIISGKERRFMRSLYWANWTLIVLLLVAQTPFYSGESRYVYFAVNTFVSLIYTGALLLLFAHIMLVYRRRCMLRHERMLSGLMLMYMFGELAYFSYSVIRLYRRSMKDWDRIEVVGFMLAGCLILMHTNTLLSELAPDILIIFMIEHSVNRRQEVGTAGNSLVSQLDSVCTGSERRAS